MNYIDVSRRCSVPTTLRREGLLIIWTLNIADEQFHSLHPSATCLGGHRILIPRVPLSTFRYITELIDRGKLDEARRWRIDYDTSHSTKRDRGKLSIRMPTTTHEILAIFAARIADDMWANGGEGSFIPPSMRNRRGVIRDWRSASRL